MKLRLFVIAPLVAAAAVAVSTPRKSPGRPLVMAHRGGLVEAEENTMKAYNIAIDRGADIIECDPKITSDGKWVIMHDETVGRTTIGTGKVSGLPFDYFRLIRTEGGEKIPTLEEVLDLGRRRGAIVFLDMHIPPPDIGDFMKIVDNHGMTDRVIVNTWVKPFQEELNRLRPDITTCFPYPKPVPRLKKLKEMGVDVVGTLPVFATKRMIRKAHRMGMKVVTMPLNKEKKIIKYTKKGLDIIQTDNPRLTEEVFGGCERETSLRLLPALQR